jgi:hypothetical protein
VRQYDEVAERWGDEAYADPAAYLARRAELVVSLGPRLPFGLDYLGVDASEPMVDAARRRLGSRAQIELGDLNEYEPPRPPAATTCFRAIYYARDRAAFLRKAAGYTERKLVFDLNPRQYDLRDVREELRAASFSRLDTRPFFTPQRLALPRPLGAALRAAERAGPVARLALRLRFTLICAASRS